MIEATPEELALIGKIANRATDHYRRNAVLSERTARTWAKSAIADELLTVHEEIMSLRLADLLTGRYWIFCTTLAAFIPIFREAIRLI